MFFILSKILGFLTQPIIWVLLLLLLAVFSKDVRKRKRWLVLGVAFLYFFSNPFIFHEANRAWETPFDPITNDKSFEYGVVLCGFAHYNPQEEMVIFYGHSGRLWHAVRLYEQGIIKKILISGGSGRLVEKDVRESDFLQDFLIECGIPPADILIDRESKNTHENAVQTAAILHENGHQKEILLITSAFHMRRSLACFAKVNVQAIPYPVARATGPRKYYFNHLFLPNAAILLAWDVLIHEWVGMVIYKVMGYA